MAHKYNLRLIKSRKSYSFKEMKKLFGIDRKTCSRWIKNEGLRVVEKGVSPLLVMGSELMNFIREKRSAKKIKLKGDEFFCFKCHKAVKAEAVTYEVIKTGKTIGKRGLEQIVATGVCEVCGITLNRFLKVGQKD